MASILRSSKFVRYIAGFARNVVINTPREFDSNFVNSSQCLCGAVSRSLATRATAQHDHEQNLDRSLRKLDSDVRRSGRLSRRDIEDVLEELRNTRSPTSSQSLLVIRCCGNLVPEELPEIRTQLVQEIWNTLRSLNVPMDVSHYNALLRVYLENEHSFVPTDFLAEMESIGVEPNRVTYQRLISRYCLEGDIEGATKILEFMREKQLAVNENVFNSLINGHSRAGDMESAHGILSVMSQAGLEPSADTYTTLMCGYAAKGDIDKIKQLLATCESKEIYILDKDLLEIVYALIVNGHSVHVPEILQRTHRAFGYVQDAINTMLKLINRGHIDDAWTILKTMPRKLKTDGSAPVVGGFFVKQMVRAKFNKERILEVCDKLKQEGMFDDGLLLATETSLQTGNEELAYEFLEELKTKGVPVRQHFFWPLIIAKASDPTGEGIIKVLQDMSRFDIVPSSETIRDYVIPNMKGNTQEIINKLREANVSIGSAASNIVYSLLVNNEMKEAAIIAARIPAYYSPDLLKRVLTIAYTKNNDLESYIAILRSIFDSLGRQNKNFDEDVRPSVDKTEIVSRFLLDLVYNIRNLHGRIDEILEAFASHGFTITPKCAETIETKLGDKLTKETSALLARLASGDLTLVTVSSKPTYTPTSRMNVDQLERLVANLEAKEQPTHGLKRQLLSLYYRTSEVAKVESLLASFKEGEFEYTSGVYAQLADLYAHHGDLEKTLECCNKLEEIDKDYQLDDIKLMRIAHVLCENGRFDDAIKMMEEKRKPQDEGSETKGYLYSSICWRLLLQIAEKGLVEELDRVFDTMVKHEFIEINNIMLGPLIKVHLVRDDMPRALEKFEWCCNQYKATPFKNELACKLIASEDAEHLQKLTDLSTSIHGEINSLYDLVFAFVECGRVRQARRILETPGLQSRPNRINNISKRYHAEGRVSSLEGLIDATKDLNYIDRSDIYYQLLLSYIKQDDAEKAHGLWLQLQEEDTVPTQEFLATLGNFLKGKGAQVPFVIPSVATSATDNKSTTTPASKPTKSQTTVPPVRRESQMRELLRDGKLDLATDLFKSTGATVSVTDASLLVEKLCQNGNEADGAVVALALLERKQVLVARVFRFLLNKLASVGNVAQIQQIGTMIDGETKKIVSYDNRLCHAHLRAGRTAEYLDTLIQEIESVNGADEIAAVGEKFPRGGAVGILDHHPELLEKYTILAEKYAAHGLVAPMNVLWSHHFTKCDYDAADNLWRRYLHDTPRIMFQRVVQHARETHNVELIQKLIEHLRGSNVTDGAVGNAYSCLLDVLTAVKSSENAEEKIAPQRVVDVFEAALKEVSINSINRTAVLRVKACYEELGMPFNHQIPPKASSKNVAAAQTSSSSSSEEDEMNKNKR